MIYAASSYHNIMAYLFLDFPPNYEEANGQKYQRLATTEE